MVANHNLAEFRDNQTRKTPTDFTGEVFAQMRECHRTVTRSTFKSWVSGICPVLHTAKERLKCFIDTSGGILEYVNMQARPKERFFSQRCQCRLLSAVVDSFVSLLVCFLSPSKRLIIDVPTRIELCFKRLTLFGRWVNPILIGL